MLAVSIGTAILSLMMALVTVVAFIVYFTVGWTTLESEDTAFGYTLLSKLFVLILPASVSLSLALALLHRRSRRATYACALVLVPLTLVGFMLAGLVRSEIVVIAAAAFSLPAWVALAVVRLR